MNGYIYAISSSLLKKCSVAAFIYNAKNCCMDGLVLAFN